VLGGKTMHASGKHLLSLHTRTDFNAISHINIILSSPNALEVIGKWRVEIGKIPLRFYMLKNLVMHNGPKKITYILRGRVGR
jgi:hypothetical protein